MVDRIRTLLQLRQLSTTQFADAIGVARPVISHILSGRNKPSLEVVQRILAAFPDLSMAWLLNGTEPMLNASPATAPATPMVAIPQRPAQTVQRPAPVVAPVVAQASQPLAAEAPIASLPVTPAAAPILPAETPPAQLTALNAEMSAAEMLGNAPSPTVALAPQVATPVPAVAPSAPVPPTQPLAPVANSEMSALFGASPGKAIRRIVIFYRDGSFADYQPE